MLRDIKNNILNSPFGVFVSTIDSSKFKLGNKTSRIKRKIRYSPYSTIKVSLEIEPWKENLKLNSIQLFELAIPKSNFPIKVLENEWIQHGKSDFVNSNIGLNKRGLSKRYIDSFANKNSKNWSEISNTFS